MALSERGLGNALESLTVACAMPSRSTSTYGELPEDIELAAYFIVSESLTNASKYAAAGRVRDPRGVPEDESAARAGDRRRRSRRRGSRRAGTGLRGLADRVDALDGWFGVPPARPARAPASARACRYATLG